MIIERLIQEIYPDRWAELELLDKKYNAIEARLGYPPKKRSRSLAGALDMNTIIIEREWESLAKMEATTLLAMADPEYQAVNAESNAIIKSNRWELYMPM